MQDIYMGCFLEAKTMIIIQLNVQLYWKNFILHDVAVTFLTKLF